MRPNWTQNDVEVNGARIHYYRSNDGASGKPAFVLQHGFSDNGLCWEEAAAELERDYDVVMPDARAHGLSARVQRGEVIDMVADLAGFVRALGLQHPIVGGHSMGAGIASQLAARHPELVRALILEDPPWFPPPPPGTPPHRGIGEDSPVGQWIIGLRNQTLEQVIDGCRAEHPTWPELTLRRWCEGKKQLDTNFFATENNSLGRWPEVVPAITCPTLLVTADPDQGGIVTPELAQQVAAMNADIRVARVAGVGHHVRFADHAAYMAAVRAFLASVA
jgi:N-formylmaleamate deformylase